ncbi:DUF3769 domain-containing protein [Synechococcus sp. CC9605]|uniref:DUF3769 domain-containing protein n=1 Tax=Synechococcus sp. (strain CC9605) TaxID=110662 RepID=UPI0002D5DF1A|nr:DUF3769 domain-containing protein [Synechococcus sp. CC9605]
MGRSRIALAAHRLLFALTGTLITGSVSVLLVTAGSAESTPETVSPAPARLNIRADLQYTDTKSKATIAEGNVSVQLGQAELHADRIEFDAAYRTLYARGAVRFRRGKQFFQASSFRYNLVQNEGQLNDVYGVIDLEEPLTNPLTSSRTTSAPPEPATSASREDMPPVACPPLLPPVPDWHPQPWAVTAWGGQMIDAAFGDTFLFNGRMRPEAVLGVGVQKRIMRAGPFAIELEADLFSHIAKQQQGGEFNQSKPYADLPAQNFGEGVLGIGARVWVQPWLSFSVIEGISYNSNVSLYEKTFRENYTQLLNYLGFEVEAAVSSDLSLVGRIHHRSGAFGTYGGVTEGSNAYLLGLRYRWGRDTPKQASDVMPPMLECDDPDRGQRFKPSSLSERLDSIALGDGGSPQRHVSSDNTAEQPTIPPAQQQAMRTEAIARINQRISDVDLQGSFSIERRSGIPVQRLNSSVRDENRFGVVKVPQLKSLGSTNFLNGTISRWRVQASKILITADGWEADRMGFSNDPFTPAQTRIDAEDVIAREQANGDVLISARRNRLIVEERLPIPVTRRQLIQKEEEVENRFVVGIDNRDRDGLFVGRNLKPLTIGTSTELSVQPQFMVQRAIDGDFNSAADLFGLDAKLRGRYGNYKLNGDADISSFDPADILSSSRYWGSFGQDIDMGSLGVLSTNLFGAYRYRTWNGSLGETDINAAYGVYAQTKGSWSTGEVDHDYLIRGAIGDYDADRFNSNRRLRSGRGSLFASVTSKIPLLKGKTAELIPTAAYRYSPVPIVPGLSLNTNVNTSIAVYGDGLHQETLSLSGGPTITLGTFSKPFLDFTQISIVGNGSLKNGDSPFAFDRNVDLATLGVGLTQQIVGPVVLSTGVSYNVDPGSKFYGSTVNSNIELRWQRRSYDVGVYFNPYKGIGGVRFRLNDFDFKGTGVPFVPYTPTNWMETTDSDRPF